MKEINLEEIIKKISNNDTFKHTDYLLNVEGCMKAMREACMQTIELCLENSEAGLDQEAWNWGEVEPFVKGDSILNVKNLIK